MNLRNIVSLCLPTSGMNRIIFSFKTEFEEYINCTIIRINGFIRTIVAQNHCDMVNNE